MTYNVFGGTLNLAQPTTFIDTYRVGDKNTATTFEDSHLLTSSKHLNQFT